jgi:signal transduction histidine kinase
VLSTSSSPARRDPGCLAAKPARRHSLAADGARLQVLGVSSNSIGTKPPRAEYRTDAAWIIGVAAAYFLAAKLGLAVATVGVTVTLVWPPSGVALAAMLLRGRRVWPGVALGAFLANATTGAPLTVAAFTAVGNPLEALAAATLLDRVSDFDRRLFRVRDVLALTLVGAAIPPIISASIGVAGLSVSDAIQPNVAVGAWFTWWGGDALGILVGTPLIIAWWVRPRRDVPVARILEAGALVAMAAMGSFLIFGGLLPGQVTAPLVYIAFPLLLWAAFSFEHRGAATGSAVIAGLAAWWTSRGAGPFARETLGLSLAHLNSFIAVATLTSLTLAAIVHERRRADRERVASLARESAARREAELASSAKSDFLAVMSHELRTPLNAIIGYVSLLADGIPGPVNSAQRAQLDRVKSSSMHLLALIEQILSLSRIEARREDLQLEQIDIRTVVADSIALVEPLLVSKGLTIESDIAAEPNILETDVTKLRQILLNLLSNACKFTQTGCVRCQVRRDANAVTIAVSDTGSGIPSEDLPHVFDAFWQGRRFERDRPAGAGLGLSVSRRLAQLLGGDLSVVSSLGQGSTFTLRLPRAAPNDASGLT